MNISLTEWIVAAWTRRADDEASGTLWKLGKKFGIVEKAMDEAEDDGYDARHENSPVGSDRELILRIKKLNLLTENFAFLILEPPSEKWRMEHLEVPTYFAIGVKRQKKKHELKNAMNA